jgi:hypothetical protein
MFVYRNATLVPNIQVRKCSAAGVGSDSKIRSKFNLVSGSGSRTAKKSFKKEKLLEFVVNSRCYLRMAGLHSELVVINVGRKRNIGIAIYPQHCLKENIGFGFKSAGDI